MICLRCRVASVPIGPLLESLIRGGGVEIRRWDCDEIAIPIWGDLETNAFSKSIGLPKHENS